MAKRQSPSYSFPDTFNFGDEESVRTRRAVPSDIESKPDIILRTDSSKNDGNARTTVDEVNNSPILFIDDESAGIIDVAKTTTVNRVLQDLSE